MDPARASLLLGLEPAFMSIDGAAVDCKLKPGDTQHFYFKEDDHPPWYKPCAPKYDRIGSKARSWSRGRWTSPRVRSRCCGSGAGGRKECRISSTRMTGGTCR